MYTFYSCCIVRKPYLLLKLELVNKRDDANRVHSHGKGISLVSTLTGVECFTINEQLCVFPIGVRKDGSEG